MARIATYGALDRHRVLVHRESFGAFKRAMPFFCTNLAKFIFLERTIQQCQFTQLILLVNVSFIINDHKHLVDHISGRIDRLLIVTSDDNMKRIVLSFYQLAITSSSRSDLDGSSSTNGNLTSCLSFEIFLSLSAGTNNKTNKIVGRVLFDGNSNLVGTFALEQATLASGGIHLHNLFQDIVAFGTVAFPPPNCARVFALAVYTINCGLVYL